MTKRSFLKSELLKSLSTLFKSLGFQVNKSGEYFKKNKDGLCSFHLVFLTRDEGWEINPTMAIRVDLIEDIFHKTSNFEEKFKKGTPTIGISIEKYLNNNKNYRFNLIKESQIDTITQELYSLFKDIALPFFDKFSSLEALDRALNTNLDDTSLTGSIFKGSKALIVAKLVNREDYKMIRDFYLSYYTSFSGGFYLPEFKELVALLDKDVFNR